MCSIFFRLFQVPGCDLFVHVGGESDGWVPAALAAAPNPRRRVLALADAGEGCAAEEGGAHAGAEAGGGHRHGDGADHAPDEHVWLSLRRAGTLVGAIAEALAAADPAHADAFRANAGAYRAKLAALDADYAAAVAAAPRRTLVVADRFPLRPLAEDYGLDWAAAFPGCSAESEASFRTVAGLAAKIDETGARCILTLEGPDHRLAETVRGATRSKDQPIVVFDSLQSVTLARANAGETYLGAMRRNLAALVEALR